MNYNQSFKFLYKLEGKKYNLSLGAIKRLMKKLGNPEKKLKVIHVAGTNGKGSVCAMVSSVLKQAGYKVGMYTSPHLVKFNERIQINGKGITNNDLTKYFNKAVKFYHNETFFEFVTALAFLYFYEKNIDFLILEVGLGGRLDATNVVDPLISVITNIGLEHERYLGNKIKKIAYEKAGIIKRNKPAVTGASRDALNVIKNIAEKNNSKVFVVKKGGEKIKLSLKGEFQQHNAMIALKAVKVLKNQYKIKLNKKDIKKGLLNAEWRGRLEFISKNILADCAHNVDAVKALKKELLKIRKNYNRLIIVAGILEDKNYKEMLKLLSPLAGYIILTKPDIKRAAEPVVLSKYLKKDRNKIKIIKNVKKAVEHAKKTAKKQDLILITGSIYTVGEALGRE